MVSPAVPVTISALLPQDLPAAVRLQVEAYPPFLVEEESVFLNRLGLAASYCLAARQGGVLIGYLLAHGWQRAAPPALGTMLEGSAPSEVLFIHDLTVSPASRGLRLGERLVERAFALAVRDGLDSAELIAVEGATDYWRRLGFAEGPGSERLSAKIAAYGSSALWMTRALNHGQAIS